MPNVLLGFIAGEDAKKIENIPEECLLDVINELLTKCFPKLKLKRPVRIIRFKFHLNYVCYYHFKIAFDFFLIIKKIKMESRSIHFWFIFIYQDWVDDQGCQSIG